MWVKVSLHIRLSRNPAGLQNRIRNQNPMWNLRVLLEILNNTNSSNLHFDIGSLQLKVLHFELNFIKLHSSCPADLLLP